MKKISSIEIHNSEFYAATFKIDFSENLNCIMGGRGTGKSTILYFIKACIRADAEEDKITLSILKNNLGSGIIKLFVTADNGDLYRIEKSLGEDPQPYILPSERHVPLETLASDLSCDIFPAQMIEEIGRNNIARLELIDKMLVGQIEEPLREIELLQIDLEKNAKDIRSENQKITRAESQILEFHSAEDDLKNHKAEPPDDIKQDENNEFEKQDAAEKVRGAEKRFIKSSFDRITQHKEKTEEINDDINATISLLTKIDTLGNQPVIEPVIKVISKSLALITSANQSNITHLTDCLGALGNLSEEVKTLHEVQHNEFVQLKQRLDKHKAYYDKLNTLSKKVDQRNIALKELAELKENRKKIKSQREKGIIALTKLKKEILEKRLSKVELLNKLFTGRVKITIVAGGITNTYEDQLRNALKGHNMRYNTIIPNIIENFQPDKLAKVIHDNDAEKLKAVTGIDIERSNAVLAALHESDAIYHIETLYCQDLPEFHLKVDKEDQTALKDKEFYKKSDELSTGQRCTTVLPIVFSISSNPLLIDQPEDNLDNKYISETIHRIIKEQKKERQLLFITHNANIPVLSESEKNVFLKYEDKRSNKSDEGNVEQVKGSILSLLEGGEVAFKERMRLYNY